MAATKTRVSRLPVIQEFFESNPNKPFHVKAVAEGLFPEDFAENPDGVVSSVTTGLRRLMERDSKFKHVDRSTYKYVSRARNTNGSAPEPEEEHDNPNNFSIIAQFGTGLILQDNHDLTLWVARPLSEQDIPALLPHR